jgi:uncharacterized membrane protein YdjX (TVP38/TMEM64 family)
VAGTREHDENPRAIVRLMKSSLAKVEVGVAALVAATTAFYFRADIFLALRALEEMSMTMPLLVAGILILLKICAAPLGFPGTPLTLLSGSLFGAWWGTAIALIGNTLGSFLAFLLARYVLREYVQRTFVDKYPRVAAYDERLAARPMPSVIALRLIPLVPYNALNFILGITKIPARDYFIGSFVGMIPGTFMFVYLGESLRMLSWVNILFAIIGIMLLVYLGRLYEKRS